VTEHGIQPGDQGGQHIVTADVGISEACGANHPDSAVGSGSGAENCERPE